MGDSHLGMMQEPDEPTFSTATRDHVKASPVQRRPRYIINRLLMNDLLGIQVREQLPLFILTSDHLDEVHWFPWLFFLSGLE